MPRDAEPPVRPGDIVAGKYRIDRPLGAGGMGCVVAATHAQLGQPFALKFLLPEFAGNARVVERFEREARAAVRLRSEHVTRVVDVGRLDSGEPYIVMEYLEGQDLSTVLAAHGRLTVGDAVEFVLQACEGIAEAHAHAIVHRDLKPQNLFLTRHFDGRPLVKVLDFGISKMGEASGEHQMTMTQDMMGTPNYSAPEQLLAARNADARSDIWALGVILYKLVTGQTPFDGESLTEICMKVMHVAPPPVQALRADVPPQLVAIIDRCLQKDPARRFATVGELSAALRAVPVSALDTQIGGGTAFGATAFAAGTMPMGHPVPSPQGHTPMTARGLGPGEALAAGVRAGSSPSSPGFGSPGFPMPPGHSVPPPPAPGSALPPPRTGFSGAAWLQQQPGAGLPAGMSPAPLAAGSSPGPMGSGGFPAIAGDGRTNTSWQQTSVAGVPRRGSGKAIALAAVAALVGVVALGVAFVVLRGKEPASNVNANTGATAAGTGTATPPATTATTAAATSTGAPPVDPSAAVTAAATTTTPSGTGTPAATATATATATGKAPTSSATSARPHGGTSTSSRPPTHGTTTNTDDPPTERK